MDHVAPACASQKMVTVVENIAIARDTFRMRLDDPQMARTIVPGQFLMIRPGTGADPFLGRPFAMYEVGRDGSGNPLYVDVVYLVVGRGTAALASLRRGDRVSTWGPLGNGFGRPPRGSVVFVAGGIGQTPFLSLARWWTGQADYGMTALVGPFATKITLIYGVRSADLLAGLDDFRGAGIVVKVATDDGSVGHQGFTTEVLAAQLESGERPAWVVGCGPGPMLASLSRLMEAHDLDGEFSMENHMACGFGACFSCVAPIRQDDGTADLRRVCVEGPIFPARSVIWA